MPAAVATATALGPFHAYRYCAGMGTPERGRCGRRPGCTTRSCRCAVRRDVIALAVTKRVVRRGHDPKAVRVGPPGLGVRRDLRGTLPPRPVGCHAAEVQRVREVGVPSNHTPCVAGADAHAAVAIRGHGAGCAVPSRALCSYAGSQESQIRPAVNVLDRGGGFWGSAIVAGAHVKPARRGVPHGQDETAGPTPI